LIPWRVKNFVSERFPLLYHFAANFGFGNHQQHWDARLADTWHAPSRDWPTKNHLIASLSRPSDAVLDIGCGSGSVLRYLKNLGYSELQGLEISRYAIERLRSEGIKMHFGKLPAIPLPSNSFDIVIASQVLEHIIRRGRFMKEIRRVLKPRGRAFIFVPDNCLGPIDEPEHVQKYNAHSLRAFLERYFAVSQLHAMQDANHPISVLFAEVARPSVQ